MGDNHQGSVATLWFKRSDKRINKTVSSCENEEGFKKNGTKQHLKASEGEEMLRGRVRSFFSVNSGTGREIYLLLQSCWFQEIPPSTVVNFSLSCHLM